VLIRTVVLIPQLDNAGQHFGEALWNELEVRLRQFGGFSRGAAVAGVWADVSRIYEDRNEQYIVALESWRQFPDWLAIVEWILVSFRQQAIYIEVGGTAEVLRSGFRLLP
jgi:hypothetical protein